MTLDLLPTYTQVARHYYAISETTRHGCLCKQLFFKYVFNKRSTFIISMYAILNIM